MCWVIDVIEVGHSLHSTRTCIPHLLPHLLAQLAPLTVAHFVVQLKCDFDVLSSEQFVVALRTFCRV